MQDTSSDAFTLEGKSIRRPHITDLVDAGSCLDLSTASEDLLSPSILSTWLIPAAGGTVPASETDRWLLPSVLSPVGCSDDFPSSRLAFKSEEPDSADIRTIDSYGQSARQCRPHLNKGLEERPPHATLSPSLEERNEKQKARSPGRKQWVHKRAMDPRRQSLALQKMFEVTTQDEGLLDSEDVMQLTHRSGVVETGCSIECLEATSDKNANVASDCAIHPVSEVTIEMPPPPASVGIKPLGLPKLHMQRKHAGTSSAANSRSGYSENHLRESMALFLQLEEAVSNTSSHSSNRLPVLLEGLEHVDPSPNRDAFLGTSPANFPQHALLAPPGDCLKDKDSGAMKNQLFSSSPDCHQPWENPDVLGNRSADSGIHSQDTRSPFCDDPQLAEECESPRLENRDRGRGTGGASVPFSGAVQAASILERQRERESVMGERDVGGTFTGLIQPAEPHREWTCPEDIAENSTLDKVLECRSGTLATPNRSRGITVTRSVAELVERFSPKPPSSSNFTPRTSITPKKHSKSLFWEQLAAQQEQERVLVSPSNKSHRSFVKSALIAQPEQALPMVSPSPKQAKPLPSEESATLEQRERNFNFSPQASPTGPSPARCAAPLRASAQFLGSKNKIIGPVVSSPSPSDKSWTPSHSPLVDPLRTPSHSKQKPPSPLVSPLCSGPLRMFPPSPMGGERARWADSRTSPLQSGSSPALPTPTSPSGAIPQQHRPLASQSLSMVRNLRDDTIPSDLGGHVVETHHTRDSICGNLMMQSPYQSPARAQVFTAADLRAQWSNTSASWSGILPLMTPAGLEDSTILDRSMDFSVRRSVQIPDSSDAGQKSPSGQSSAQPATSTTSIHSSPSQIHARALRPETAHRSPSSQVIPSVPALAHRSPLNKGHCPPHMVHHSPSRQAPIAPARSKAPSIDMHIPASAPPVASCCSSVGSQGIPAEPDVGRLAVVSAVEFAASIPVSRMPSQGSHHLLVSSTAAVVTPLTPPSPSRLSLPQRATPSPPCSLPHPTHTPPPMSIPDNALRLWQRPAQSRDDVNMTGAVRHSSADPVCNESDARADCNLGLMREDAGMMTSVQQRRAAGEADNRRTLSTSSQTAVRSNLEHQSVQTSGPCLHHGTPSGGSHTSGPATYPQTSPDKGDVAGGSKLLHMPSTARKTQLGEAGGSSPHISLSPQIPSPVSTGPKSPAVSKTISVPSQSPRMLGDITTGLKSPGSAGNAAALQVPRVLELQKDAGGEDSDDRNISSLPLAGKAAFSAIPAGPSSRLRQPAGTARGYGPIRQSSRLARATRAQEDLPLTKQGGAGASLIPLPQSSNLPKPASDAQIPKISQAWLSRSAARLGLPGWKRTPSTATTDLPTNAPIKGKDPVPKLGQVPGMGGDQQGPTKREQSLFKRIPSPRDPENNPKAGNTTKLVHVQTIPSPRDTESISRTGTIAKKHPVGKATQKAITRAATPELDPHIAALLEHPDLAFGGRGGGVVNSPLDAKRENPTVKTAADRHYIEGGWDGVPLC
eukprot:jgi/Botrbrau1/8978/Bobra.0148s0085.1